MSIKLKTVPPLTPGMAYGRVLQGNRPDGMPGTGFTGSEPLNLTISEGQGLPALFSVGPVWTDPAKCQFVFEIPGATTAHLAVDDSYYGLASAVAGGQTWPLAAFYVQTLPSPGMQTGPAIPDLVKLPYAMQLLAILDLAEPQLESIPTLISAASDACRSFCNRRFDQGVVAETLPVEWNGSIRMSRPPVNYIMRVQDTPRQAMSISNAAADSAYIYPATTGDVATGQAVTGMTLNWTLNGVPTSQVVPYVADQTVTAFAATVNAVGNGWSATPAPVYGSWPVTELHYLASKGASPADRPDGAAIFDVLADSETGPRFDPDGGQRTGIAVVGRAAGGGEAGRWGPGGESLFGMNAYRPGVVRVTYNGGFAAVPGEVQVACVELVKAQLERFRIDMTLRSESAGEYRYEINDRMILALPINVLQGLSRWRLTDA